MTRPRRPPSSSSSSSTGKRLVPCAQRPDVGRPRRLFRIAVFSSSHTIWFGQSLLAQSTRSHDMHVPCYTYPAGHFFSINMCFLKSGYTRPFLTDYWFHNVCKAYSKLLLFDKTVFDLIRKPFSESNVNRRYYDISLNLFHFSSPPAVADMTAQSISISELIWHTHRRRWLCKQV